MTTLILGASGKIGKFFVNKILSNELLQDTTNLILQYNNSPITLTYSSHIKILPLQMDILNFESITNFLSKLPNQIDTLINLLSIFEETPLNTSNTSIEKILKGNFLNQTILLKELLQKNPKTLIQFLDYSIEKLYTKKYFWYSVSRDALFSFYKHLEKYSLENNLNLRIIYILPRMVEKEEDFRNLFNSIQKALSSKKRIIKKVV